MPLCYQSPLGEGRSAECDISGIAHRGELFPDRRLYKKLVRARRVFLHDFFDRDFAPGGVCLIDKRFHSGHLASGRRQLLAQIVVFDDDRLAELGAQRLLQRHERIPEVLRKRCEGVCIHILEEAVVELLVRRNLRRSDARLRGRRGLGAPEETHDPREEALLRLLGLRDGGLRRGGGLRVVQRRRRVRARAIVRDVVRPVVFNRQLERLRSVYLTCAWHFYRSFLPLLSTFQPVFQPVYTRDAKRLHMKISA